MAIGIGGMVGGGIFAVLGLVAEQAGGGTPLAFLLAGVVALVTASSYALLTVAYPSRGGSVVFIDRVFGVRLATGVVNNVLWFGYLVTLSLYASAFASYAAALFDAVPTPGWLYHLLVSAAVLVPTGINLVGARFVARSETAIVVTKLVMLVVVCGVGFTTVDTSRLAPGTWPPIPAIAAAGMLVFVAYEGFELIANAAEDVRRPERTLPRALYLAVGAVIVIYVAVAWVTVGSLSPEQIATSSDFALAEAAEPSLGSVGFVIVSLSAVLATFSAINATLYGTARLSYAIAKEGELPAVLERDVWSEPVGLLITCGVALVLANALDLADISAIASAVFLLVFGLVNAAAYRLPARRRVRHVVSAAGVVGCGAALVVLLVSTAQRSPVALVVLAALLAVAGGGEAVWLSRRRDVRLQDGADT
ncbi:MAG: APC family permease [Acidimicrobiales bacterium]